MTVRSRVIRRPKRAAILVVLIFIMTLVATLFGLWGRQVLREQHQLETQKYRLQAVRLAEAGVRRLAAKHALDEEFQNESWTVPADQLDNRHAAIVRLQLHKADDGSPTKYVATATFPADSVSARSSPDRSP